MKQMLSIHDMAQHMAEHNTPFSAGTIEGILTDFVKCIREQVLNGNSVKIDNLAIFKISVHSNAYRSIGDIDPKTGVVRAAAKLGSAVREVKLLAQASGDFVRAELAPDARFSWDTESQAKIEAERKKVLAGLEKAEQLGQQVMQQEAEDKKPAGGNGTSADEGDGKVSGGVTAAARGKGPVADGEKPASGGAGQESGE
ncbi:MAG: hypothetical protein NC344_02575 [Bacteroidales bacterium]|nr:hypothetical protein [Bacteroidales bacterium]MCM1146716.1 hypothetical protein [Bacteroidales bacterium]MCM1205533.1 hypothetical protein [Bacillota bacterium]